MDNKKWTEALRRSADAGYVEIGKRMVDAEMRIERGVAVRRFHVTSEEQGAVDKTLVVNLSDELSMLSRTTIKKSIEWLARQGIQSTEADECNYGWNVLRDIVRTGVVENVTEKGRVRWGYARMTLARLYDDLILSHHWPRQNDGEAIFYINGYVPPSEPQDDYWLAIQSDGQTFSLAAVKPAERNQDDFVRGGLVEDGQHRAVAMRRFRH